MNGLAKTIVCVIVPAFLVLGIIGFVTRDYDGDLLMKWTDLIKVFNSFPDPSEWIGDINSDFIAQANAMHDAWMNMSDAGGFFIALGRTFASVPAVIVTVLGYIAYPFICLYYCFGYILKIVFWSV